MKNTFLTSVFFLLLCARALSCSCSFGGPFLEMAPNAAVLIIGRIESIDGHIASFTVQETFKGKASGSIKVYGDRGDQCLESLRNLKAGQTYAFALSLSKGTYALPGCGRYYVEINGDVASGMINRSFMKDPGNGWPVHNGKTMPLAEFKTLLIANKGYDFPCRKPSTFTETEESKKAFATAESAAAFDEWALGGAVRKNDLKLVTYLLDKFDVKSKEAFVKAGFDAASNGSIEMLQLFLDRGFKLDEVNQYTGSLLSVSTQYPDMVQHLLKLGVNTELKNMWGATALMSAVSAGCPTSVQYLLAAGANVNVTNSEGETVLKKAKASSYDTRNEIVSMLKERL